MEHFDKKKFDEHNVNGEYIFAAGNGIMVKQVKFGDDSYVEYTTFTNTPKQILKEYDAHTLSLKNTGELFYGFQRGKWHEYNTKGELQKETDWDKPYAFSIEELDEKMKKMGVYIMKPLPNLRVSRSTDPPEYNVTYPAAPGSTELIILIIDGTNGKTIKKANSRLKEG